VSAVLGVNITSSISSMYDTIKLTWQVTISHQLLSNILLSRKVTMLLLKIPLTKVTHFFRHTSYPMCPEPLSLGIKWPGRDTNNTPPSSAEVKNAWSYTSTPTIRLRGVVLS
jgi:hypothetical protein